MSTLQNLAEKTKHDEQIRKHIGKQEDNTKLIQYVLSFDKHLDTCVKNAASKGESSVDVEDCYLGAWSLTWGHNYPPTPNLSLEEKCQSINVGFLSWGRTQGVMAETRGYDGIDDFGHYYRCNTTLRW